MNKLDALIFLHVWFVVWIILFLWYVRGKGAEKCYYARMKRHSILMPGKLKDKEYYIRFAKRFAWLLLIFGVIAYFSLLFEFLTQPGPF